MKTSQTVWGFTGIYLHSLSSFSLHLQNIHKEEITFFFTHTKQKNSNWSYQSAGLKPTNTFFSPLLLPSPISSFYGLYCKALKIYKIKWLVGRSPNKPGDFASLFLRGSKPYRSYQKDNNHSINFAPFETFSLFPLKEEKKNTNKYTLGYEHTIYTSTIKWKTGTT